MESDVAVKKSTFVTVVAWIFIVISGFGTLIAALQNIMIHIMFNNGFEKEFQKADPEALEQIPAFATFVFSNLELMAFLFFLLSLITFITAIALLKRKNWARLVFIGLLGLGIVWNLGGLFFQQSFMSDMMDMQENEITQNGVSSSEPCCESDPCCKNDANIITEHRDENTIAEFEEKQKEIKMQMKSMMKVMFFVTVLFALVFSAIHAWIIWKLVSPPIVAEFKAR